MPGVISIERRQYYAHPRNRFWSLMGLLAGAGPELPYAERLKQLERSGIGLWDVLQECVRAGSLDARIEPGSETPNDFPDLLLRHPRIEVIALNGNKAAQAFRRLVQPTLAAARLGKLTLLPLPSTSPANASRSLEALRDAWAAALGA
jgi:hypoxanthine-DNA glycosylase